MLRRRRHHLPRYGFLDNGHVDRVSPQSYLMRKVQFWHLAYDGEKLQLADSEGYETSYRCSEVRRNA